MKRLCDMVRAGFAVVLSCTFVLFFGLHAVQVTHQHPGAAAHHDTGSVIVDAGVFHAAEKKLFVFLLLSLFYAYAWAVFHFQSVLVRNRFRDQVRIWRSTLYLWRRAFAQSTPQRFSFVTVLFSEGILHPKNH